MTTIVPSRNLARGRGTHRIWVDYNGRRWYANGVPITPREGEFVQRGTYHGFPVYVRPDDPDTIYIPPVLGGLVTPFRLKPGA